MSDPDKRRRFSGRAGWRMLRRENERGFDGDFSPIRRAIFRSELLGSVVELFVSALVGVGKINLGLNGGHRVGGAGDGGATPTEPRDASLPPVPPPSAE